MRHLKHKADQYR